MSYHNILISEEAQEFGRILRENGVSPDTIQKLAANGLKSMLSDVHCHDLSYDVNEFIE